MMLAFANDPSKDNVIIMRRGSNSGSVGPLKACRTRILWWQHDVWTGLVLNPDEGIPCKQDNDDDDKQWFTQISSFPFQLLDRVEYITLKNCPNNNGSDRQSSSANVPTAAGRMRMMRLRAHQ
jgi:hypothetical protein